MLEKLSVGWQGLTYNKLSGVDTNQSCSKMDRELKASWHVYIHAAIRKN